MLRTRTRMSARVWKSNNRRTAPGTCPQSGAEGDKPQQQRMTLSVSKAESWKITCRVEFGRL
ncbi:hypothetical protein [Phocaeicola vulgatus]|uniref:hypothetical protein n=1 Tax=Phocaeicola vulgatus TaxID=821 RepID=UPI0034A1319A